MESSLREELKFHLKRYRETGSADSKREILKIMSGYEDTKAIRQFLKELK